MVKLCIYLYWVVLKMTINSKGSGQDTVHVSIAAPTYFGARHGMETLGQMISYDDMSDTLQIYETAHVEDSPSYSHRGVLLDTSRNFISKKVELPLTNSRYPSWCRLSSRSSLGCPTTS